MKPITAFLSMLSIAVASFSQPCSTNDNCSDADDCTTDICASGACINADSDIWLQKQQMSSSRFLTVGFSINGKGYIGTGRNSNNDFWEYDPATNSWTEKAPFPGGYRDLAVGFSIGNKGYIGTGYGAGYNVKNDFWEYDPATNTWTRKADFAGTARKGAVGFSIGNKGYIGTGDDVPSWVRKDFWEYDPATDTWTRKADFGGYARTGAVGFSIGNKGYIGTGYIGTATKDFWEYDPAANTWTRKANFIVNGTHWDVSGGPARYGAVGFSIGNKGYIGTGSDRLGILFNNFWEYNPATNYWTEVPALPAAARRWAVGFSIGNKGYIGAGTSAAFSQVPLNDFWEYNVQPCDDADYDEGTGFVLINALSDGDIGPLNDGDIINLAALPTNKLNIRFFKTDMVIGSVTFKRNGLPVRTENDAPYAMAGDEPAGDYSRWTPAVGAYEVCATPHSGYGGTGIHGETQCVHFTVVNSSSSKMSESEEMETELNESELQLYPNPNQGVFQISYSSETITDLSVEVFDLFGKAIFHEELPSFSGAYQCQLDLSEYPQGVYLLRVDDGEATSVRKVVISE